MPIFGYVANFIHLQKIRCAPSKNKLYSEIQNSASSTYLLKGYGKIKERTKEKNRRKRT